MEKLEGTASWWNGVISPKTRMSEDLRSGFIESFYGNLLLKRNEFHQRQEIFLFLVIQGF